MKNKFKLYVASSGVTQQQIADVAGVTLATVNNWVNNPALLTFSKFCILKDALLILKADFDVDTLIDKCMIDAKQYNIEKGKNL
jgi:transcriptional regulator with XRE-family HTH domain